MENKNLHELVKALHDTTAQLPLHQGALRERLLKMHRAQTSTQRRSLRDITAIAQWVRDATAAQKIAWVGAAALVAGVLILGLLMLLPASSKTPNQKFIAKATGIRPVEAARPTRECSNLYACRRDDGKNSKNNLPAPQTPQIAQAPQTNKTPATETKPEDVTSKTQVALAEPIIAAVEVHPPSTAVLGAATQSFLAMNTDVITDPASPNKSDEASKDEASKKDKPSKEGKESKGDKNKDESSNLEHEQQEAGKPKS